MFSTLVKGITERNRDLRESLNEVTLRQLDAICKVVDETLATEDETISEKDLVEMDYTGDEPIIRTKMGHGHNRVVTWPDISLGDLPSYNTKKNKTKKATASQKEIISIRDKSVARIEERYCTNLKNFDQQKVITMTEADRWKKCWENSIKEVKMLYNIFST